MEDDGLNATFLEALVAWLEGSETVSALFTGGIYNTQADPYAELPYLVLRQTDSNPLGTIGRPRWVDKITIAFEARATLGDAAELLVEQLRIALFAAPISLLGWSNGQECGRYLIAGAGGELEEGLGPNGEDVWVQRLPIGFTITRNA